MYERQMSRRATASLWRSQPPWRESDAFASLRMTARGLGMTATACQISNMKSGTPVPSPSITRPRTTTSTISGELATTRSLARYLQPISTNGPTVWDDVGIKGTSITNVIVPSASPTALAARYRIDIRAPAPERSCPSRVTRSTECARARPGYFRRPGRVTEADRPGNTSG